ncbi:MAG: right-handed parallel beta-helix repeat-containing protein, partial [Salinibacterium sp.]|nr:right-handed parallel beta-helix repeat-containing protein [Salinibacterium sp.]
MEKKTLACGLFALCLFAINAPSQVTWYVDDDAVTLPLSVQFGTIDFPFASIAQAFVVAMDNDRVVVRPGTYSPSLTAETFGYQWGSSGNMNSHFNVEIVSSDGPEVTILDAEGSTNFIFRFRSLAAGARVRGFTFRNSQSGTGAIRLGSTSTSFEATDVEITQCIFENNIYGIATFGASDLLKIHGNLFINNNDNALWVSDLTTNPAPGGSVSGGGDIYNNTIVYGPNNGIRVQGGTWNIFNNIIAGNANNGIFDFGLTAPANPTSVATNYNCVFGNGLDYGMGFAAGPNDVNADPMFVSPLPGPAPAPGTCIPTTLPFDYHLMPGSPCIDAAAPGLPAYLATDIDLDPRRVNLTTQSLGTAPVDIGADEVNDVQLQILSQSLSSGSLTLLTAANAGAFQQRFASINEGNV